MFSKLNLLSTFVSDMKENRNTLYWWWPEKIIFQL